MENLQVDRLPNDIISRRDGGGKGDGEPVVGGGSGRIEWWSRRLRGKRDRGCAVEGFATQSRPEGTISNGTKHESAGTVDLNPLYSNCFPSMIYANFVQYVAPPRPPLPNLSNRAIHPPRNPSLRWTGWKDYLLEPSLVSFRLVKSF